MSESLQYPLLSVITVSYNSVSTIGRTLESLRLQTDQRFESIVIDGGSTDGTTDRIKKFSDVVDCFVSEPDRGIYDAMNKGIERSNGNYLAFLNSDDAYLPYTVERVLEAVQSEPDSIVYGNLRKERVLGDEVLHRDEKPDLSKMPETMGVFHPALFTPRSLFEQFGNYDTRFSHAADYHWFLRAYLNEVSFRYIDAPLAIFRVGGVSNQSCVAYREAAEIQREFGTGFSEEMEKLYQVCRMKRVRNKVVSAFAEWPFLGSIYRNRVKKRWN